MIAQFDQKSFEILFHLKASVITTDGDHAGWAGVGLHIEGVRGVRCERNAALHRHLTSQRSYQCLSRHLYRGAWFALTHVFGGDNCPVGTLISTERSPRGVSQRA